MFSESFFHYLTPTPAELQYGTDSRSNTSYTWSNIHTQKSKFDPEKCYFKAFPSTPSTHVLQHFNEVYQLTELKNQQKYQVANSSEACQPV